MDIGLMVRTFPFFLEGAATTIAITVLSTLLGIALAVVVAVGRVAGRGIASKLAYVYVTVTRGVPLLVQIFIVYFGLNQIARVNPFSAGVIALGICTAGYLAEAIRSGIMSVHPSQFEAARSLGLSYAQTMRVVVLPQALSNALPAMSNEFVTMLKASSLVSAISVVELTRVAYQLKQGTARPIEMYLNATLLYLVMTTLFVRALALLDRRWGMARPPQMKA
jgi:polar amino acid transport system permease protein